MSYRYDVFLSYRRHYEWPNWVENHFLPLFKHWLAQELGRDPLVFVDYECIEEGDNWPIRLARELSDSKILVPLWSPTYFNSEWCTAELCHMYAREKICGFRTPERPEGLIIPISIHDGDRFPPEARQIQYANFQDCANVRIARNSRTEEKLSDLIRNLVPKIVRILDFVPPYDQYWNELAYDEFLRLFEKANQQQMNVPSSG